MSERGYVTAAEQEHRTEVQHLVAAVSCAVGLALIYGAIYFSNPSPRHTIPVQDIRARARGQESGLGPMLAEDANLTDGNRLSLVE